MRFDRREQNLFFFVGIAVLGIAAAIRVAFFPPRRNVPVPNDSEFQQKQSDPVIEAHAGRNQFESV